MSDDKYDEYKVYDLREFCKERDIPIHSGMEKAQLIQLLKRYDDRKVLADKDKNRGNKKLLSARREEVLQSYNAARAENNRRYLEDDPKATEEYIFSNQIEDAVAIVDKFYKNNYRVISIQKKTKVGADGLMIEIAKLLTTHSDDDFVVNPSNVRIITGMSNAGWEKDMIEKAPSCFKDKIFHHGKLSRSDLVNIKNSLIIIDEIDTGDKEYQKLHDTLMEAGLLNVKHMETNNNRFVFISATMIKELYELYKWGDFHYLYKMTIPSSYIGHKDFLERGIVREFYAINNEKAAERWVKEDIIDYYDTPCLCVRCNVDKDVNKKDYRVHIIRVNNKIIDDVRKACIRKGVIFKNHTSTDKLTNDEINEFFKEPLTQHIVLGIKGFFRRANLIPNIWKLRIGSMCELYTRIVDNNVQIQGLVGRMTGYWREIIEVGHKTGPFRTSIKAIREYEQNYDDPFGLHSYKSAGFKKKRNGSVTITKSSFLDSKHIENLNPTELPKYVNKASNPIIVMNITDDQIQKYFIDRKIFKFIKKYNREMYEKYNEYKVHCWRIDTPDKCEKWRLKYMLKPNALSSETNIVGDDKRKNVLMVYLHENKLIFSAWSGEKNKN